MAAAKGNTYALGNNGGRPAHYETPEDLAYQVNLYFDYCKKDKVKATVTGLALYLGFCSRASFDDYEKRNDEFSYIIKRAKLAVENSYELSGQTIDIFALKNMGWKDESINKTTFSGDVGVKMSREEERKIAADLENEV